MRVTSTENTLELRINGALETRLQAGSVNVDAVGQPAIIGHNGYAPNPGFQAFEGEIAEICAAKGRLTDEELAELEGYLLDKYGLR